MYKVWGLLNTISMNMLIEWKELWQETLRYMVICKSELPSSKNISKKRRKLTKTSEVLSIFEKSFNESL